MSQHDENRATDADTPRPAEERERPSATERAIEAILDEAEVEQPSPEEDAAPEAAIAALETQLREATDRALRAHAELDNYRKRMNRLMEEERRYAAIDLMRDLLPVWDNMGRAIEAAEQTRDTSSLLEGLHMMHHQLLSVLERHECKKIDALGQPFDPHLHQAIAQQPSAEAEPNNVLHVAQEGFLLHDRVVRPTQVVVATRPPESE